MIQIPGRSAAAIADAFDEAIRDGRWAPEMPLPSVRRLAGSLRVSAATVAAAYRQLQARGLTSGDRRRGTRVRARRETAYPSVVATPRATGLSDLASGNPDPALWPSLPAAMRALTDGSPGPVLYGDRAELPELVAFARAEFRADGIAVDQLLVTHGALDAIDRVMRAHLHPGDRVLVEDPGYPPVLDLIASCGYAAEPIAMDADGPIVAALEAGLRRRPAALIVTPRAQNPTGAAIAAERATHLGALLANHPGLLVIENDPFSAVANVPAVTLTADRSRWAIVRSLSKFLGPDLRVAILAADAATRRRVAEHQMLSARWVSHLLQRLTVSMWSDPASGRQLARAAALYAERREALVSALAEHDVPVAATSGFNVWIPVHDETTVVQQLAASGWSVAAGERFRLRSGPGVRVTTSAVEAAAARRFARDLAAALRSGRWVPA